MAYPNGCRHEFTFLPRLWPFPVALAVVSLALLLMWPVLALQQYWTGSGSWQYVPVTSFAEAFKKHKTGLKSAEGLAVPFDKTTSSKDALVNKRFSLSSRQPQRAMNAFQEHFCLRVFFSCQTSFHRAGLLESSALSPVPCFMHHITPACQVCFVLDQERNFMGIL